MRLLELDRFSAVTLRRWQALSNDLDELQAALFFGVQPAQRRLRPELLAAIADQPAVSMELDRWVRIVTYRFSNHPLSAAGSLTSVGGRFNPGPDLDQGTMNPFPALYIAENHETAFREKFLAPSTGRVDGLGPAELALAQESYSAVMLRGRMLNLFDLTKASALDRLAQVFGRIALPAHAQRISRRLKLAPRSIRMVKSGQQLRDLIFQHNWRVLPVQFGIPAASHIVADLIREAGFSGILYRSTKGAGRCIAIFPDRLSVGSFVDIADRAPDGTGSTRLDDENGVQLAGWETLPRR